MERIIKYIKENLSLDDNGLKAIELLGSGSDVEKRLLVCIAIDIKFGLIDKNQILKVLNKIKISECKSSLTECYDKIVNEHKIFTSNIPTKTELKLVRVMKASSFTKHFFNKIKPNGIQLETTEELRKQIERENLKHFYMYNNSIGKGNLVWATILEQLLEILTNNKESTNDVIIRLGLTAEFSDNNEYVYIEYPKGFDEEIYQPCNFSNDWQEESSFYISYKQYDGFGRTRSRLGDFFDKGMKETVHKSINEPNYKYSVKYLGVFDNFNYNVSNFVNESITRFEDEK